MIPLKRVDHISMAAPSWKRQAEHLERLLGVILAGQAGVAGHLTICKGAKVGGGAAITRDVPAGSSVNGYPAIPIMLERRIAVLKQRLPELFHRVDALEEQVAKLAGR